jgi:HD-GYP domain-containing protein (c-di-GMP phosphodiesterase class II)
MYKYKISQTSSDKSRVVDMLLAALSEKDYVAQGHVERISRLCQQMADTLDLRESQKRNLLLLSKIHDLGKIGVPDEILNKPGKLTRKEFDRMKSHVSIGFNIASRAKELVSVAPYILHHHEHWDGTGYPDGLRGEEIPLECRILGIIDAFDAMTNDRPYQEGISVEEAVEEIKRGAGKQFDPYLVEKFLEILAAGNRKSDTDVRDNIVRRENADAGNNAINRDNVNS